VGGLYPGWATYKAVLGIIDSEESLEHGSGIVLTSGAKSKLKIKVRKAKTHIKMQKLACRVPPL
jgi:hypothetical protein